MGPYELLQKIVEVFERLQIPYLVTGSVAAMAYGEPRLINYIDIIAYGEDTLLNHMRQTLPPLRT